MPNALPKEQVAGQEAGVARSLAIILDGNARWARQRGLPVLTVYYAVRQDNVAWVYRTARELGFVPFASSRHLDRYLPPVP